MKIGEYISDYIGFVVGPLLFILYIYGMYAIIVDDHRYTTKDVVIGAVVFPYPWWVGAKEGYRIMSTSSDDRKIEEKCLDALETVGVPRKSRLRYCECVTKTHDREACKSKIFGK